MTRTKSIFLSLLVVLLLPTAANADLILQQLAPDSIDYVLDVDFTSMAGSGLGDVTSIAEAVDWDLGLGNVSTSGCETSDFFGFTAGNIALLQRGTCFFRDKVDNAILAGAIGAIIFNQGNVEGRFGLASGTLLPFGTDPVSIPVVFATYDVGIALDGAMVRIKVPEPGTMALFGIGLFGIGLARRRRRA